MYHYTESGLRNVWLENGYNKRKTVYGNVVSIENIEGLHRVLAMQIIREKPRLSGAEFRFLRKELDMSQAKLAAFFGYDAQTIALWEKNKVRVPKLADRAIRAIYREIAEGNVSFMELVERLNDQDRKDHERKLVFKETDKGWMAKAA